MSFTHSIILKVIGDSSVTRAIQVTSGLDSAVDKVNRDARKTGVSLRSMGNDGNRAFSSMTRSAAGFLARLGGIALTFNSLESAIKQEGIEEAISFSSAGQGAQNIEFLNKTVDDLGIRLSSATTGWQQFLGGVQGTSINMEQARNIFQATSKAMTVMKVSGEASEGVFLALSQMASKGKVSAEELRGQLGERLPGAFSIAARAMGVTTGELDKMLSKGEIMAEDFLPKFAGELERTFGGAAQKASQSATAKWNRMLNSLTRLKVYVGTELLPTALQLVENFLIPAARWIGENIKVIGLLVTTFGALYVAAKSYTIISGIVALVTGQTTIAFWGLNSALLANPLTWVAAAFIAVAAAVVYAWKNFSGFRGFIIGSWEVLKETGRLVYEFLITPFKVFGKILKGVFTFDRDLIQSGIEDATNLLENTFRNAGKRLGDAYKTGYQRGVSGFNTGIEPPSSISASGFTANGALAAAFGNTPGPSGPGGLSPDTENVDSRVRQNINSVNGGGRTHKNVTINLGKFFDQMIVQSGTLSEGADEVADIVLRKMFQVLNTANQAQ